MQSQAYPSRKVPVLVSNKVMDRGQLNMHVDVMIPSGDIVFDWYLNLTLCKA